MQQRTESRKIKVLIIDDDPIVLAAVKGRLERASYQVYARSEALGTVQFVRAQRPDFVLIDLRMPALDGTSLASLLAGSDETRRVGVILYSSAESAELTTAVEQVGAIGGISKAETPEGFVQRFDDLVGRHTVRLRAEQRQ